jgi:hypothetical protein
VNISSPLYNFSTLTGLESIDPTSITDMHSSPAIRANVRCTSSRQWKAHLTETRA